MFASKGIADVRLQLGFVRQVEMLGSEKAFDGGRNAAQVEQVPDDILVVGSREVDIGLLAGVAASHRAEQGQASHPQLPKVGPVFA